MVVPLHSSQSCLTSSKRRRHSSNTGRDHYGMENSELYILALTVTIFSLVMFPVLYSRKLKLCRGCMFSNAVKIMIFILDVQYCVHIKLCKTAGSIHLFKLTGTIKPENVTLNQNYIWDTLEKDWKEVNVT